MCADWHFVCWCIATLKRVYCNSLKHLKMERNGLPWLFSLPSRNCLLYGASTGRWSSASVCIYKRRKLDRPWDRGRSRELRSFSVLPSYSAWSKRNDVENIICMMYPCISYLHIHKCYAMSQLLANNNVLSHNTAVLKLHVDVDAQEVHANYNSEKQYSPLLIRFYQTYFLSE